MNNKYEHLRLKTEQMISNVSPRLPLVICIDASTSMLINQRMKKINNGIKQMLQEIKEDPYSADTVELSIISFGGKEIIEEIPFGFAGQQTFQGIKTRGDTPLGSAIMKALNMLDDKFSEYDNVGIEKHKPWLIIISDGRATDDCEMARAKLIRLQKNNKLRVFAIAMGEEGNYLDEFTIDGRVLKLEDFKVDRFFSWISRSMSKQGQSYTTIDETVEIDEWIK